MKYDFVATKLITDSVLAMIVNDFRTYPQNPCRVATTLEFRKSAFYKQYGEHWENFLRLRDDFNRHLSNPSKIKKSRGKIIFELNSNDISPDTLAILNIYLGVVGWDSLTVKYRGSTFVTMEPVKIWTVTLTPKEGEL